MLDERKTCPICSFNKFKTIYYLPYKDIKIQQFLKNYYLRRIDPYLNELKKYDYVIAECLNCSLMFQKYIPNIQFAEKLYDEIIDEEQSKIKKGKKSPLGCLKDLKLIKKIVKKENSDISILEFGSGNGYWANYAKKLNFDITVNEYSSNRIKTLKEKGFKICTDIETCKEKFDIIYADQVFEHIPNPGKTFKLLFALLNDKGYIFLKFPSAFMFKNKLKINYRPKKDSAHPLEHINILNRKTFSYLAESLNLEISYYNRHSFFSVKKYLKFLKDFFYFDKVLIKKIN